MRVLGNTVNKLRSKFECSLYYHICLLAAFKSSNALQTLAPCSKQKKLNWLV